MPIWQLTLVPNGVCCPVIGSAGQWMTTPGTRATRPETKLPTPASVTMMALPSENRPEQKARSWRRRTNPLSFSQRCWRTCGHPMRSPEALFRQPSSRPRTGAPHVTGARKKHHAVVTAESTITTTGPAAWLIHAAISRRPLRTPHHLPRPPSPFPAAPEVAMACILVGLLPPSVRCCPSLAGKRRK